MTTLGRMRSTQSQLPGVERDDAVGGRVPEDGGQRLGVRLLGAGLHELDAEHGALAAHLADDGVALRPVADPGQQGPLDALRLGEQVVALDDLEDGERRRGRDRVAAEGAADAAGLHGIHDLGAAGDGGEREAARDALRARDEVGHDAVVLDRVPGAGAGDAGLDLVGDEHDAVLGAELLDRREVAGRRDDDAAVALDRLDEERGDLARADVGDDVVDRLRGGLFAR